MRSDSGPLPTTPLDFSVRSEPGDLAEWMDEPCPYEEFHACLADLAQVNRLTLAYRPTLRFMDALLERHGSSQPFFVVDVGCGGGDMLRRIAAWAARRHVQIRLTGIDLNPYARRYVEDLDAGPTSRSSSSEITWRTGDAFTYEPPAPIDVVLSSLFTHHLPKDQIVHFLAWMEQTARLGWFVNDLLRSPRSYQVFQMLSRTARWHSFVQHDGPVSIRRSFRDEDWRLMTASAGLETDDIDLEHWFPGRLCVRRLK